jgi:hypothetical protein
VNGNLAKEPGVIRVQYVRSPFARGQPATQSNTQLRSRFHQRPSFPHTSTRADSDPARVPEIRLKDPMRSAVSGQHE